MEACKQMSHSLIPVTKRKKGSDERRETDCGKEYIELVEEMCPQNHVCREARKEERKSNKLSVTQSQSHY